MVNNFNNFLFQTLRIIQEQGTVLSDGFESLQSEASGDEQVDEESKAAHLKKEEEYRGMFLSIRERAKKLLKDAADFIAKIHYHRVAISEFATSIDKRYKDLEQVMKQYRESLEKKLETTLPDFQVLKTIHLFLILILVIFISSLLPFWYYAKHINFEMHDLCVMIFIVYELFMKISFTSQNA